jgi:hypothetical protein
MRTTFALIITILFVGTYTAEAQIGNILNKAKDKSKQQQPQQPEKRDADQGQSGQESKTQKRYEDREFLLMGRNDLNGQSIRQMKACTHGATSRRNHPPMSELFIAWSTSIEETAALRSFETSTCQVIAFLIDPHTEHKYNSIDALTETAQGTSIYKVEVDKLVLIRKVDATQFYVVVVPDHNKPGLTLADLRVCGYPDTIKLFKRQVNSGSNCHDQKQKLYVFEQYKQYPGPMQTSSVLFDAAEFAALNKQGKFKGLVIYKLVGQNLIAVK